MATVLQIALPAYRSDRVRITFGPPIASTGTRDVHAAVLEAMRVLIDSA